MGIILKRSPLFYSWNSANFEQFLWGPEITPPPPPTPPSATQVFKQIYTDLSGDKKKHGKKKHTELDPWRISLPDISETCQKCTPNLTYIFWTDLICFGGTRNSGGISGSLSSSQSSSLSPVSSSSARAKYHLRLRSGSFVRPTKERGGGFTKLKTIRERGRLDSPLPVF